MGNFDKDAWIIVVFTLYRVPYQHLNHLILQQNWYDVRDLILTFFTVCNKILLASIVQRQLMYEILTQACWCVATHYENITHFEKKFLSVSILGPNQGTLKKFQSVLNLRLSLSTTKTNFTHKMRYEGTSTFSIIETLNPLEKICINQKFWILVNLIYRL